MQLAVVQRRHYYLGQVKYWKCARIPSTGCQFTRCCTGALRWLIYCSTWKTLADFKATLVYLHDCSHHPKCLDFVKGKQSTCNLHEPWHRHRMLIKISDPREFSASVTFVFPLKWATLGYYCASSFSTSIGRLLADMVRPWCRLVSEVHVQTGLRAVGEIILVATVTCCQH